MLKGDTMHVIVESHNNAVFSEISAIFQVDAINNIAGLLELTIPTKTFSGSDANRSK